MLTSLPIISQRRSPEVFCILFQSIENVGSPTELSALGPLEITMWTQAKDLTLWALGLYLEKMDVLLDNLKGSSQK